MSNNLSRAPEWMRKLPSEERTKAWAIYLFMLFDQGKLPEAQLKQFEKCVERAGWPDDGLLPDVSKKTAERLGLEDPRWDSWRRFSTLRVLLRKATKIFCKKDCAV